MKILIVDNSAVSRVKGRFFTNNLNGDFINELILLNNTISYFQFYADKNDNISVYDLIKIGVRCVTIKIRKNKILRYLLAYLQIIPEIVRADFVYFYYPNSFRFAAFYCILFHRPYGIYVRGMNGVEDNISKMIYKSAYTVFTVSDYFTNLVNDITHSEKAHTIRPMIPYTESDVLLNRKYVSKERFNVLFLGRIVKDKGLTELIGAAEKLHLSGYQFDLHLVGNGEYLSELKLMVQEKNMNEYIYFDGPIYDDIEKANCYQKADLYVLPTYHEGFPRTLYEAMIFGTPIITTFVGGIPALMKDGENCLRIEPRSVDSIVDRLSYAMNHYDSMANLAANGTKLVSRVISAERPSHAMQLHNYLNEYGK